MSKCREFCYYHFEFLSDLPPLADVACEFWDDESGCFSCPYIELRDDAGNVYDDDGKLLEGGN